MNYLNECLRQTRSVEAEEGCYICENYKHMVFTGYKTTEDSMSVDRKSKPHVSGGVIFCPRCGKKL